MRRTTRATAAATFLPATFLLVTFLLAATPPPATAHPTDPTIVTRVDSVTPDVPGLDVEVRSGAADQLLVVNRTRTATVEVIGTDGAPFLRIGPTDVRADVTSRDWRRSNSPFGNVPAPPAAGKPRWTTVATGNSWGWFDHRLHDTPRALTPELRNAGTTVRLADWTVPLRHGTTNVTVRGHVEYRPVLGSLRGTYVTGPEGVVVDVLDGRVPGVFLRWTIRGTLVVRGAAGEPFARFTDDGVEVNDASPTWQEDQRLRGVEVTTPADPKAPPEWRKESDARQLTWLDRRLAYAPGLPPDDVVRAGRAGTLVDWTIPVEVDGVPARLEGRTDWVPAGGDGTGGGASRTPWRGAVYGAVGGTVGAALVVVLRRLAAR